MNNYIIDACNCPKCNYMATRKSNYINDIEYIIECHYCGYKFVTTEEGESYEENNYGTIHKNKRIIPVKKKLNIEQKNNILLSLKDNEAMYIYENNYLETLKGDDPLTAEDYYDNEYKHYNEIMEYENYINSLNPVDHSNCEEFI